MPFHVTHLLRFNRTPLRGQTLSVRALPSSLAHASWSLLIPSLKRGNALAVSPHVAGQSEARRNLLALNSPSSLIFFPLIHFLLPARRLRRGDALAVPRGWALWVWNNADKPMRIMCVADTSHGPNPSRYTSFHLMGAQKEMSGGLLHGFR